MNIQLNQLNFDVNYRATIGFDTLSFDFMGADLSDKFLGISMGFRWGVTRGSTGLDVEKPWGKTLGK